MDEKGKGIEKKVEYDLIWVKMLFFEVSDVWFLLGICWATWNISKEDQASLMNKYELNSKGSSTNNFIMLNRFFCNK